MAPSTTAIPPNISTSGSTVSGVFVSSAPAFTAKGSRVFAPCGRGALCFGVKTARQIGGLPPQTGVVTAVCAGALREDKLEPLATGSSTGEVRLWDSKSYAQLGHISLKEPVLALRWPRPGILVVYVGGRSGKAWVEHLQVDDLTVPRAAATLPLSVAVASSAFDAFDDVVAVGDVKRLHVWSETWKEPRTYLHRNPLTVVLIDSDKQFVAAGDSFGAVLTWWGILGEQQEQVTPARWHWHSGPVRSLALCGPVILSGGDEGVLCLRQKLDSSGEVRFIPRFPGPLRHLAVGAAGTRVCASLGGNTLALMDNLLGKAHPTYIHGIDVPLMIDLPKKQKMKVMLHETRVLYPLASSGVAMTSSGRRVEFLNDAGVLEPQRTLEMNRGPCLHATTGSPEFKWHLWHIAFSPSGQHILTCESRRTPARESFLRMRAANSVLKWWTRTGSGYGVHTVAHNVHGQPLSAVLAHPHHERRFITASLDGTFKFWDLVPTGTNGSQSWQCVLLGSWHSQPIHCGCLSADGSALALGLRGFVTLWDAEDGSELSKLALSEPQQDVQQLQSAVACGHFLLLAHLRSSTSEEVLCWDLETMQVLAQLDLRTALEGHLQQCLIRSTSSVQAEDSLHLLAHRSQGITLQLWQLQPNAHGPLAYSFKHLSSTTLEDGLLDALFVGQELRLLCWTTAFELRLLDLSKSGAPPMVTQLGALVPADDEPEVRVSQIARLVGSKAVAEGPSAPSQTKAWQLTIPPVRATAAQQAGLVPRFTETVVPAHIPSHMLHPPAMIWASMLATFSKPSAASLGASDVQPQVPGTATALSVPPGQQLPDSPFTESDLPPWMQSGQVAEMVDSSEVVEATWMDHLVQEALQTS